MTSAPIETKVTVAALSAMVLPAVDSFLALLQAFGAGISPEQRDAFVDFVQWQLPIIVAFAAYSAPHTFRYDLEPTKTP